MKKLISIILIALLTSSCAELLQVAKSLNETNSNIGVSNSENISGLKSSLNVGLEKAVNLLGTENGFYNDLAYKLLLPDEAQPIINNIKLIPGGQELVNKTVLSLNRSAEDAVKEAIPIFKNAILNMTFSDATNILFGADNAATEFLRINTYAQLKDAFQIKVKQSLSKPLVANVSTTDTWNLLHNGYNSAAKSTLGKIAGLKEVNINIEDYVTGKALDAIFMKIAIEEKLIRKDPIARTSELLKKVFGQLDKK
jgi:hypothetical protein